MSIKASTADADAGRKEPGALYLPVDAGKKQGINVTGEEVVSSSVCEQQTYMEISYQNGTTVRLGGERDMELVRTPILLSR